MCCKSAHYANFLKTMFSLESFRKPNLSCSLGFLTQRISEFYFVFVIKLLYLRQMYLPMCSIKKILTSVKTFASSGKMLPWLCLLICLVSLSLSYSTSRSVDAMETRVSALEQSISTSLKNIDQTLASIDVRFKILEKYAAEKWEWLYGDASRPTVEINNNVESKTKSKRK